MKKILSFAAGLLTGFIATALLAIIVLIVAGNIKIH
jgi:hypothetical protein